MGDGIGPADGATLDADGVRAELQRRFGGSTVLVADDNVVNQEVARALLDAVGLRIETADDGQTALDWLRRRSFDLVLMDVRMPGMDGLAATRALRAWPGYAGLPVLAMTADAYDDERAACLAAGMDDHVAKPVDPDRLYAALLRWLARGAGTAG